MKQILIGILLMLGGSLSVAADTAKLTWNMTKIEDGCTRLQVTEIKNYIGSGWDYNRQRFFNIDCDKTAHTMLIDSEVRYGWKLRQWVGDAKSQWSNTVQKVGAVAIPVRLDLKVE